MSNKKRTNKTPPRTKQGNKKAIKICATLFGIMAAVYVVISIVFGTWNPIAWGKKEDKNGITISARTLTEKEYALYGLKDVPFGAKLLSVEFEPADASDKRIKWAIYFENATSKWAADKNINEFVDFIPAENRGATAVINMKQAFGERIIVKAECLNNPLLTATIKVERVARIDDLWDGGSRGVDSLSDTLVFCSEYADSTDSNGLPYTVLPNEFHGTVKLVMDTGLYEFLHTKQGVEYDDATETEYYDIATITTWGGLISELGLTSYYYPYVSEYMYSNNSGYFGTLYYSIDYYYAGEKIGRLENQSDVEFTDELINTLSKPVSNITINPDKVIF
ncbi:MAG: hypothetical protein K2L42_07140 [Clostridia bacterium]|nr:hypothetical protein [Clostridia bacterium]